MKTYMSKKKHYIIKKNVIIYLPSCCSKPIDFLLCITIENIFLKMSDVHCCFLYFTACT